MPNQHRHALPIHGVLNPAGVVGTDGTQLGASGIKTNIQNFVGVVFHGADALALLHVPEFDGVVRRCCSHLVAAELELRVGQLAVVAHEGAHAVPRADVPDFGGVVEGRGQDLVALRVETDGDHLLLVPAQFVDEAV